MIMVCVLGAAPAWADEPATRDAAAPAAPPADTRRAKRALLRDQVGADGIEETVAEAQLAAADASAGNPLLMRFDAWRTRLRRRTCLEASLAYTALFQHAHRSRGRRTAAAGDFDLMLHWHAFGRAGRDRGSLEAHVEWRHDLGARITPSKLGEEVGSLMDTTEAFNRANLTTKQLYWAQQFLGGRAEVAVGIIDVALHFFGTRMTNQNTYFLHPLFSDAPSIDAPSPGLGVALELQLHRSVTLRACASNADGTRLDNPLDDLFEVERVYKGAELTWKPCIRGLGYGNYHVGAWHADGAPADGVNEGYGFNVSFDQELGDTWFVFGQYDRSRGGRRPVRRAVRGGVGAWVDARGADDLFGIGFGQGRPYDRTRRDEWAGEVFYRFQVGPNIQLTPSAQWIVGTETAGSSPVWVFGLRVRAIL